MYATTDGIERSTVTENLANDAFASPYKELPSQKVSTQLDAYLKGAPDVVKHGIENCRNYVLTGSCEHGHLYAKVLVCGREYCPVCGGNHSEAHERRLARLLDRAQQMESVGYLVIEWPLEDRTRLRSVDELSRVGKIVARVLRDLGYSRGLRRWHWFGDPCCPHCKRKGKRVRLKENLAGEYYCPKCGAVVELADAAVRWNPHLNVLVDGEHLQSEKLLQLKETLKDALGAPRLIVNYSYHNEPRKILHKLRYITRSTFRAWQWDREMAILLHGFRNTSWWGTGCWNEPHAWELDGQDDETLKNVSALEKGCCPECAGSIAWGSVLSLASLSSEYMTQELEGGYLRVIRRRKFTRNGL